jgi:hypothetical protein
MTIERELLRRISSHSGTTMDTHFIYEIQELLTQPENKREPIDEEELEVWYSQHTWAMEKQEYMWGFRDAEKAHGIGGDDD